MENDELKQSTWRQKALPVVFMHTMPLRYSYETIETFACKALHRPIQSLIYHHTIMGCMGVSRRRIEAIPCYGNFSIFNERYREIQSTTYGENCTLCARARCSFELWKRHTRAAVRSIEFNKRFILRVVSHLSSADFLINFPRIYKLFDSMLKQWKLWCWCIHTTSSFHGVKQNVVEKYEGKWLWTRASHWNNGGFFFSLE